MHDNNALLNRSNHPAWCFAFHNKGCKPQSYQQVVGKSAANKPLITAQDEPSRTANKPVREGGMDFFSANQEVAEILKRNRVR